VEEPVNDLRLVAQILCWLDSAGTTCALFGGWAEELRGLRPPGPHKDVDLLIEAQDFAALDALLASVRERFPEIEAKRFAHKRAFRANGVMVELFLVRRAGEGLVTPFWDATPFCWIEPLWTPLTADGFAGRVASIANLRHYRQNHHLTRVTPQAGHPEG
jgi:hypothetical protein